jgi:signal transduction histidine kinase
MNPRLKWLLAIWQRCAAIVVRAGRELARWAAAQSWSRLAVLALLALMAQNILTSNVLHWGSPDHESKVSKHRKIQINGKTDSAEDEDADIRIDENGIRITHHRKPDATPPTPPAPGAPGTAPSGDSPAGPAAGPPPVTDSEPPAAPSADENADNSSEDEVVLDIERHTVQRWLKDAVEGLVLLLIVYLIAAKIVLRQTAKSDARAAQAEESAAAAAAVAEREALQRQLAQAQLQALQAQVEPHFLFNTLASVDYLIETDPVRASAMQKNLIQYLRAALPQMRGKSSQLGREGDLARAYLEILKVRMEDRLQLAIEIPDGLRSADFPPMMLQSLVENAIKHGVEPKPEGGEVRVTARVVDGHLEVAVADTGIGLSLGTTSATAGGGVGLGNVRERLARLYEGQASFSLAARSPTGAVATIRLPYRVVSLDDRAPGALAGNPATSSGQTAAAAGESAVADRSDRDPLPPSFKAE